MKCVLQCPRRLWINWTWGNSESWVEMYKIFVFQLWLMFTNFNTELTLFRYFLFVFERRVDNLCRRHLRIKRIKLSSTCWFKWRTTAINFKKSQISTNNHFLRNKMYNHSCSLLIYLFKSRILFLIITKWCAIVVNVFVDLSQVLALYLNSYFSNNVFNGNNALI